MYIQDLRYYIKLLKRLLRVSRNDELKHRVSICLVHLRNSLEDRMEENDRIIEVASLCM